MNESQFHSLFREDQSFNRVEYINGKENIGVEVLKAK